MRRGSGAKSFGLLLVGVLLGCGVSSQRVGVDIQTPRFISAQEALRQAAVKHRVRHVLYSVFWAPAPLEGANLQEQAFEQWLALMNPSTADNTPDGILAVQAAQADPTACDPSDLDGDPNDDNCSGTTTTTPSNGAQSH